MNRLDSISSELPQTRAHKAIVWLVIVVLGLAFFGIEHFHTQVSLSETFTLSGDEFADRAAEGDSVRRMAIPAIALLGFLLLMRREGWQLGVQSKLGWLLIAYIGWCGLSVLWSVDPKLTIRHFVVLLFCAIGALGVARQVTLRDLCVVTLVVSTALILNSLRVEIQLGTFRPWAGDYRFSGTVHPNVQAPYCATMALAAACLANNTKRGKSLLWLLCAFALVMMVLTKSRTVCGAFLAGLLVYGSFGVPWPKRIIVAATIVWVAATAGLIAAVWGSDLGHQVVNGALMGRGDETESLSGRVPLWLELIPYVQDRFLFGHGYLTFWSPQRIETFSRNFQWTCPDGHCAYLDSALDLGVVGMVICLVAVFTGVSEAARRYRLTGDMGCGFLFALFACRSLNALLESNFAVPTSFAPFVMVCGLAHLGFCREPKVLSSHAVAAPEMAR